MKEAQEKQKCMQGKILWVDEDTKELDKACVALRNLGLQVVTCGAYSLGLRLLDRHDFDLIVVGQGGPSFGGRCILERAQIVAPRTPVLILTNQADMRVYLEAMDSGATDYLEKAADPIEMIRDITGHMTSPGAARGRCSPANRV
jgi:DNA-binding NtrC family response regulator